jgi:cytochrome P450
MAEKSGKQFDPSMSLMFDEDVASNPHRVYKQMRDHGPVIEAQITHAGEGGVLVSRHQDVVDLLRDPATFSSKNRIELGQKRPIIPLQMDPPEQTRLRKLMAPLFSPAVVNGIEAETRKLAVHLIDPIVDRGGCNFHEVVANPLPSTVFLQLLGLPVSRATEFLDLKDGILHPDASDIEERAAVQQAAGEKIYAILEEIVDQRIQKREKDWISSFLDSEVDGETLTRENVIDIGYLFFIAGLDTVSASLGCIFAYLAQHPDRQLEIAENPSVIPGAIEELLRFESPVTSIMRLTTKDTEIGGCPIRKGTNVQVELGSANTDERFMKDAGTIDFHRRVNKHIAFGVGAHRCLGSHLARMELRVVVEEWHKRIPSYRLAPGCVPRYSPGVREVSNLELVW